MRRLDRGARALAVALGILLLAGGESADARSRHTAAKDSVRVVKRISVSDRGIEIDDHPDPSRQVIEVGGHGVRIGARVRPTDDIAADADSDDSGPGITVDVGESGLVRVFSDAEVSAGERVDGDVVAVFGSVRVAGEVTGDVVAVFGSVRLEPGASAGGDVVAIGGVLDQQPGATVNGESVSLGFLPMQWGAPTLQALLGAVLMCWVLSLIMGWLLHLIFPTRMLRVAVMATRRPAASFFLGLFSAPLLIITIVLLLVTVIGVPFALLLPIAYLFGAWAGQLAMTYVLGTRLLRRRIGEGSSFAGLLAGTLFVAAFFIAGTALAGPGSRQTVALFFTLLGGLIVLGLSAFGTGAVLISGYGSRPKDIDGTPAFVPGPTAGPGIGPAMPIPATPTMPEP